MTEKYRVGTDLGVLCILPTGRTHLVFESDGEWQHGTTRFTVSGEATQITNDGWALHGANRNYVNGRQVPPTIRRVRPDPKHKRWEVNADTHDAVQTVLTTVLPDWCDEHLGDLIAAEYDAYSATVRAQELKLQNLHEAFVREQRKYLSMTGRVFTPKEVPPTDA